jgi:hypothetical protein
MRPSWSAIAVMGTVLAAFPSRDSRKRRLRLTRPRSNGAASSSRARLRDVMAYIELIHEK